MAEIDHEEWRELRTRVDSLASAVFLIAGGALTLSVSVLLGLSSDISPSLQEGIRSSWLLLLGSIIGFIILKVSLIVQSFMRGTLPPEKFNRYVVAANCIGWGLGLVGLVAFVSGMYVMVNVALAVIFRTHQ